MDRGGDVRSRRRGAGGVVPGPPAEVPIDAGGRADRHTGGAAQLRRLRLGPGRAEPQPGDHRRRDRTPGVVPDYIILFHVSLEDAAAIAARFGMQESYDPRLGQPLRAGAEAIAACILSRHPLYDAELMTVPSRREPSGIRAWSVVGGRKSWLPAPNAEPWEGTGRVVERAWLTTDGGGHPRARVGGIDAAGIDPRRVPRRGGGFHRSGRDSLPGNWRPRLTFAGPWQAAAGASWDTNNARVGVWASLGSTGGRIPACDDAGGEPATTRPGRM